jgi:hypothetical protein
MPSLELHQAGAPYDDIEEAARPAQLRPTYADSPPRHTPLASEPSVSAASTPCNRRRPSPPRRAAGPECRCLAHGMATLRSWCSRTRARASTPEPSTEPLPWPETTAVPPCQRRAATLGGQGVERTPVRTTRHGPCLPSLPATPPASPCPCHGLAVRDDPATWPRCRVRVTARPLRLFPKHPPGTPHTPAHGAHTHTHLPHRIRAPPHRIPPRLTRGAGLSARRKGTEAASQPGEGGEGRRPPARCGPRSGTARRRASQSEDRAGLLSRRPS